MKKRKIGNCIQETRQHFDQTIKLVDEIKLIGSRKKKQITMECFNLKNLLYLKGQSFLEEVSKDFMIFIKL